MPIDSQSSALWAQTAPPPPATAALEGDVLADVAVVGAGFTGLSAALHLAESGARVVVLDAACIGFGGSGRNVGLVNAALWLPPGDVVAALGAESAERVLQALSDGPELVYGLIARHAIACEAVRNGTLHCAVGPAGLRDIERREREWQARGAPVRVLDAAQARAATGTAAYTGALLDRRAGTVQPLAYAHGLAAAAIRAGAVIHTGSAVTACTADGTGWRLRTAGGSVRADWVIPATNAYSGPLWPGLRDELVLLPYCQFATEPLPPAWRERILPGGQGCWDTAQVMSSFRLDAAGRLIWGGIGALEGGAAGTHRAWARRALRRLFPGLGRLRFAAEWHGRIGMTRDHMPRFHELAPRVICFHGYNGRGIGTGTVFGKLLARHILGGNEALPLPAAPARPVPLRGAKRVFYERGAQLVHGIAHRL